MLQVDLATLSGEELRSLLDSTRRRGQASLTYEILQEMAARRERSEGERRRGLFPKRKPAPPRLVEVALGDPLDPVDEFADDFGETVSHAAPPEPEAGRAPEPVLAMAEAAPPANPDSSPPVAERPPAPKEDRPLSSTYQSKPKKAAAAPAPAASEPEEPTFLIPPAAPHATAADAGHGPTFLRPLPERPTQAAPAAKPSKPPPPPARTRAPSRLLWATIGLAVGLAGGVGLDRWAAGTVHVQPAPAPPPLMAAAKLPAAAPVPAAPPEAPVAPIVDPAAAAPPADPAADTLPPPPPSPPPEAREAAPPPAPEVAEIPQDAAPAAAAQHARAATETAAAPVARRCAAQPTPADRAICGDPGLQRLQRELRQVYGEALDAHADRALLRQRQLAWADARNGVTDPARLTRLYEERIRKLKAATAAARRER